METPTDVLNWQAFAIGCAALIACLLTQGTTVVTVMSLFKPQIRAAGAARRKGLAHLFFFSSIICLLLSHIAQIYIWALFLWFPGIVENFHLAILFAGSTYTTVGFANDNLALHWQLLAVIMAISGLFAFAWSTSIMYALSQQVYPTGD